MAQPRGAHRIGTGTAASHPPRAGPGPGFPRPWGRAGPDNPARPKPAGALWAGLSPAPAPPHLEVVAAEIDAADEGQDAGGRHGGRAGGPWASTAPRQAPPPG